MRLPNLQTVQFPDGSSLCWREWGAGAPLIMLHGWSMSSAVFAEVAEALAAHYRILCPDLPGHGGSSPVEDCSLAGFAAALGRWIDGLDLPPAALLGWSLGGQVAMQAAGSFPAKFSRLLLVATTPKFCQSADWTSGLPPTQVKALDRNLGRAYEKTLGDFFKQQFVGEFLEKQRFREILNFAVRSAGLPDVAWARKVLLLLCNADQRGLLPRIKIPTLVQHGVLDRIIPYAAGEYLAAQIPEARLASFPGVGHAPFFSQPAASVAAWRKFLQ